MAAQPFERVTKLPRPRPRNRIIDRDHKSGARRRIEPPLDKLPRLQVVGEGDRTEVMTERRADPRSDCQHCGNAGDDCEIQRAPSVRSSFDFFAYSCRHGKDARIAAGNNGDVRALRGMKQRGRSSRFFFPIVRSMPALSGPRRHAIKVRSVAVERFGVGKRVLGFRRHITWIAWPQSDHGEVASHCLSPGRFSQPGTRTTAKYGASSSRLALSGIIFASAMVPRST